MREMIMKLVPVLLLVLGVSSAQAGQVIVNQGLSSADTFALRDKLAREHEWQEWLRFQQAVKWLEVLPVNCEVVGGAGQEYRCGDDYYRPYRQNGRDLYIQGDPPGPSPQRPIKKAP
ncbi:hypothetical protein [Aeromonas taiwanensis]|uniref:hypothetical protein n=1 Tax=Aeromonas taiwanensis TaxID=633417 RepID=UPI003B9DDCB2